MTATAGPTRREQILDAAAELFARYGFHGVGIDDIGKAVGISGPALYRHFRSKDAMLAEMLTGISERLLVGGRQRVTTGDPRRTLDRLVRWHVEFALTNPSLITVQLRDLDSVAEPERRKVRELQRSYVEVWRGTSEVVQLFWIFFALPLLIGFELLPLWAGILVLGLNHGAYGGEIVR